MAAWATADSQGLIRINGRLVQVTQSTLCAWHCDGEVTVTRCFGADSLAPIGQENGPAEAALLATLGSNRRLRNLFLPVDGKRSVGEEKNGNMEQRPSALLQRVANLREHDVVTMAREAQRTHARWQMASSQASSPTPPDNSRLRCTNACKSAHPDMDGYTRPTASAPHACLHRKRRTAQSSSAGKSVVPASGVC